MPGQPHLTVLVPAFNEERVLADSLQSIHDYFRRIQVETEILVIDDGSTDRTAAVAAVALKGGRGSVLKNSENSGKGFSFRKGVEAARGRWLLLTDADLSAPIAGYERLAKALQDRDLDMAIGSRAVAGAEISVRQGAARRTAGRLFNGVVRMLTGLGFRDTQCGFKLLDRARLLPLVRTMKIDGFAFDVELLFLCSKMGLRVEEVPVEWANDENSNVRLLTDPFRMIWDLLVLRWNFRRGGYRPDPAAGPSR